MLVGWHQDDVYEDLGPVHVQVNDESTAADHRSATFVDSHQFEAVERRLESLPDTVLAVEWENGRPVGVDPAITGTERALYRWNRERSGRKPPTSGTHRKSAVAVSLELQTSSSRSRSVRAVVITLEFISSEKRLPTSPTGARTSSIPGYAQLPDGPPGKTILSFLYWCN